MGAIDALETAMAEGCLGFLRKACLADIRPVALRREQMARAMGLGTWAIKTPTAHSLGGFLP